MLIRNKEMHFQEFGDKANPSILFGHSYLWDMEMWKPQIEYFSKNYHCETSA